MQDEMVSIKGINEGIQVSLSPSEEWGQVTAELANRIDEQASFFAGANIIIDVGSRAVPKYELSSLKALLERRNLTLAIVISESDTTLASAEALDIRTKEIGQTVTRTLSMDDDDRYSNPEEEGTSGIMIRRTLRSGRSVNSRGHVVIFGDVNPGAKIVADGDIIIWGKLRGTVHAGAGGNTNAIVCALEMRPNQLRIAHYITVSPTDKPISNSPEVAQVQDDQIVVNTWN